MDGRDLPALKTELPGPESRRRVERLAETECPAITARRARRADETGVPQDPIVWEEAVGANVRDVDGNVFVDLTAAFAVAGLGHRHPAVVEAAKKQADLLIHAMGDVYPGAPKIDYCDRLAEITPGDLQQSILGLSGSDAVVAALKSATVHTGRPGVIAFWGGYHGLAFGALSATAYRDTFREPFLSQLGSHVHHVPYPDPYRPPFGLQPGVPADDVGDACLSHIRAMLENPAAGGEGIGAVIVEPIQGRGGEVVPPPGFLQGLREICDEHGLVLIFDEIFTGFARTGSMFACEEEGVLPDILCVGKGAGGGFPISAAIGRPHVMESWGLSSGEAIHTSTFLGNPMGCAMALAVVDELVDGDWPAKVRERGEELLERLRDIQARHPDVIGDVRGRGLMLGVDLVSDPQTHEPNGALALEVMEFCRQRGYLVLPSGIYGNVLGLSPPFVITDEQLNGFFGVFEEALSVCG